MQWYKNLDQDASWMPPYEWILDRSNWEETFLKVEEVSYPICPRNIFGIPQENLEDATYLCQNRKDGLKWNLNLSANLCFSYFNNLSLSFGI